MSLLSEEDICLCDGGGGTYLPVLPPQEEAASVLPVLPARPSCAGQLLAHTASVLLGWEQEGLTPARKRKHTLPRKKHITPTKPSYTYNNYMAVKHLQKQLTSMKNTTTA